MSFDEIIATLNDIERLGCDTVVLQAGEHPTVSESFIGAVVRRIKARTRFAVALSLGEHPYEALAFWRTCGADRYLLKFETSDVALYRRIHPPVGSRKVHRYTVLEQLKSLGYEVGSGIMTGIPGQTVGSVARDISLFRSMALDMIAIGPFIPHPRTPMGKAFTDGSPQVPGQAPNTVHFARKVIALSRIVCPTANIPATAALEAVDTAGEQEALMSGANVVMHNVTPARYRRDFDIYPVKGDVPVYPRETGLVIASSAHPCS
jgi:biotin synthase